MKHRVVDLAWRHQGVELYSAHGNGMIRVWKSRTKEDVMVDEEEREDREAETIERDKKRKVLQDMYQDFARKRLIFSQ